MRRVLERLEEEGQVVRDGRAWALPPAGVATLPGLEDGTPRQDSRRTVATGGDGNAGNAATGQALPRGVASPLKGAAPAGNPDGDRENR